jgi:hypothetical protein
MNYNILYINTEFPEDSYIMGSYPTHENAIDNLLEKAHYRETNGVLTYYHEPCTDYPSLKFLKTKVRNENELRDLDLYKIQKV